VYSAGTPLTGIEFRKRLPCGEVERARRAIRKQHKLPNLNFSLDFSVISSDPPCNDGNARFITVSLKAMSDQK